MSAAGYRLRWHPPMYIIEAGVRKSRERFLIELEFEMGMAANDLQTFAQQNHPWQNRTGDAERLFKVEAQDRGQTITMEHGVYYGRYLEAMQGGRYGVIPMTFTYGKSIISDHLQRSLDRTLNG